jgi:hypothetical protein
MSLLTYNETRPWARSIKENVVKGKMPPWLADPHFGKFANDLSLKPAEIDTIVRWVDSGAAEGSPADAPPSRNWNQGWNIPQPDLVVKLPMPIHVPAKGTIEYQYIVVPSGFTEDKWVQAVEVRPSQRALVHHAFVMLREPSSNWLREAEPGVPFVPQVANDRERFRNTIGADTTLLASYTPGSPPEISGPGKARLVKAGTDFVFQMHYTANGTEADDQTSLGLTFARNPPKERIMTVSVLNSRIKLPAGDPNYSATAEVKLRLPSALLEVFPHMHLRGKSFQYDIQFPDGHTETVLKLKNWDLNWQLAYRLATPLELPGGSIIRVTAWWDNPRTTPPTPTPRWTSPGASKAGKKCSSASWISR